MAIWTSGLVPCQQRRRLAPLRCIHAARPYNSTHYWNLPICEYPCALHLDVPANGAQHVANIWSGTIITRNGALQLLLLVDYNFDWARDVYRDDIIRELRVLAACNNDAARVFYKDPDIFSTIPVDHLDHLAS